MEISCTGLHHCSIVVTDLERASRFYSQVLGLEEIPTPSTFDFEVVWFQVGEEHIHLMPKDRVDTISPRHLALQVEDAKNARNVFREKGVEVQETVPIPGADRFFVSDPDGNRIEIVQWFKPWPQGEEDNK